MRLTIKDIPCVKESEIELSLRYSNADSVDVIAKINNMQYFLINISKEGLHAVGSLPDNCGFALDENRALQVRK